MLAIVRSQPVKCSRIEADGAHAARLKIGNVEPGGDDESQNALQNMEEGHEPTIGYEDEDVRYQLSR